MNVLKIATDMDQCKYYKEMHDDGLTVMCVSKVYESGERICIYPNSSIHRYAFGEIGNTATPCTFQEFEIIRLITNEFLK
ncbi:hypothetical protein CCP3SC1AL1_1620016 [Gammaproteobacteria bacterium]